MNERRPPGVALWILLLASVAIYGVIAALSPRYALGVPAAERPLLTVLGLYAVACCVYFVALYHAVRTDSTRGFALWIFGASAVFRLILLPTTPFQEIDIYRYLWDGAVFASGESPYEYPPQRIVSGVEAPDTVGGDERLARLVELAQDAPALNEIVRTIHYAELPSPYPPVSQSVFAAAAATSPRGWSATQRLTWLKGWLVLFDLATLLCVLDLLRRTRLPVGWAVAYGWCPLVLKEVAGSGHLDAIATFFVVAALAAGLRAFRGAEPRLPALVASTLLGLGVGAKLFPVVLAPLLAIALWRRNGARRVGEAATCFVIVCAATLAPMLWPESTDAPARPASCRGRDRRLAAAAWRGTAI